MGLLENLTQILRGNTTEEGRHLSYGRVEQVEGWPAYDPTPIAPGTHYVRLWLQEMWLQRERAWLDEFYPMAYSVVSMRFGASTVSLPASLGEFTFDSQEDFSNLSRALRLNYPMTPLLPYNGGELSLQAALVSIRHEAGLREAIDAVCQFSQVLAVPQLSAVIAVAGPFADTLDALLVGGHQGLMLGLHQTFNFQGEEELREGYYVVAGTEDLDFGRLIVDDGRLKWTEGSEHVREFDYMLFRLEVNAERDDYEGLTAIYGPMLKAEESALEGESGLAKAEAMVLTAGLAAFHSVDLTAADRRRLPGVLRARFDEFLQVMGLAAGAPEDEAAPLRAAPRTAAGTRASTKDLLGQGMSSSEALSLPDDVVMASILGSWPDRRG